MGTAIKIAWHRCALYGTIKEKKPCLLRQTCIAIPHFYFFTGGFSNYIFEMDP